ncbi:MAG: sigma-70 family RNA polymerase sigma factor [Ruminococcus sp.]|nr:sigma-70 family RNA polymerase sigma factor [Ruminococcus sp.]
MNKEFDEIYRLYSADLYRFILNLCRNEAAAMDIMQDTMLRAIEHFDRFKGECSVKTYLFTIARNLYLDTLKKAENKNISSDETEQEFSDGISFVDKLTDKESALTIHRLLHRLDEPYKEIFSLRVFAELSFREIGDIFGNSENWARTAFFRAKKKLITLMAEEEER